MLEHTDEMKRDSAAAAGHTDYADLFETEQKRRRGLQSKTDKLNHENKLLQKQLEVLRAQSGPQLTDEQKQLLEDLKYTDPDAYYTKRQSMEAEAGKTRDAQLAQLEDEVVKEVKAETMQDSITNAVPALTARYNDFAEVVTDAAVAEHVPPRIAKQFEDGTMDAEAYLDLAYRYITAPYTQDNPDMPNQPNLGSVAGGQQVSEQARIKDLDASYANTIF